MSSKFQGQLSMVEAGKNSDLKPIHLKGIALITYRNLNLYSEANNLYIIQMLTGSNHLESRPHSPSFLYFNLNFNGNIHVTRSR